MWNDFKDKINPDYGTATAIQSVMTTTLTERENNMAANDKSYSWDEINAALMETGHNPKQIAKMMVALHNIKRSQREDGLPRYLLRHSQWNQADYQCLADKGYTNQEIKKLWDRDAKRKKY